MHTCERFIIIFSVLNIRMTHDFGFQIETYFFINKYLYNFFIKQVCHLQFSIPIMRFKVLVYICQILAIRVIRGTFCISFSAKFNHSAAVSTQETAAF